jgi:hypothetical protein
MAPRQAPILLTPFHKAATLTGFLRIMPVVEYERENETEHERIRREREPDILPVLHRTGSLG